MKKRYRIILSIFALLESIFLLTIPYLTEELIDAASNQNKDSLILFILLLVASLIISIVIKVFSYVFYSKFQLKLEKELKQKLFGEITVKEYQKIIEYHSSQLEVLFNEDVKNIVSKEISVIPNIVKVLSKLVLAVALLIYYDWKFLLVVLAFGLVGLVGAKLYSMKMKTIHKDVLEKTANTNSYLVESSQNVKLVRAYNANENVSDYYNHILEEEINSKKKRNLYLYSANAIFYAFSALIYIGPLVYGAYGIYASWFTYGVFMALVLLVRQVESPLLLISGLINQYSMANASNDRLKQLFELPNDKEIKTNIDFDKIIFEDVSFSYNENQKVLSHFNLEINKDDIILLSGRSGIGKTTLFMLLLGFLKPDSGRIYYIKDNKEYPIGMDTISLFSYVPQENVLFSLSILDNMKILTKKDESSIIEALKMTNIYDELMALPDGLNTILKTRGQGLSLGQIQRILIAIALLHDGDILLLDEFSSALDIENEKKIIENLKGLNKTIIYITHRQLSLENSKRVVLEELC